MSSLNEVDKQLLLVLRRAIDPPVRRQGSSITVRRGGSIHVEPGKVRIPDGPEWTDALRELMRRGFVVITGDAHDLLDVTDEGMAEASAILGTV